MNVYEAIDTGKNRRLGFKEITDNQRRVAERFVSGQDTIQYNSLLTLPWWGFSVTMRLLIKIREVVNNSIKKERVR